MRQRQPATLDLRAILRAGFDARGRSAWHTEPGPDGRWSWHASALAACPRAQILKRAAYHVDEARLESLLTFEVGHAMHALIQEAAQAFHGLRFRVLGIECGGHHPTLPLAARADLIYTIDGLPHILDIKTESSYAGKHRRDEARAAGLRSAARAEHALQLAATAMVCEAMLPDWGLALHDGWIVYIDKETGSMDQQPVALNTTVRSAVETRLEMLEQLWAMWELAGELPPRLPDDAKHWNCRPRGDLNTVEGRKGMYCDVRTACYTEAA